MSYYTHPVPYKNKLAKRQRDLKVREANKRWVEEYKLQKGCADCGYKTHHAGLEFDHIPGSVKEHNVSALYSRNRATLKKEIDKCDIVCGTCHNIRTWKRRHGELKCNG